MNVYQVDLKNRGVVSKVVVRAKNIAHAKELASIKKSGRVVSAKQLSSMPIDAAVEEFFDNIQDKYFKPKVKVPSLVATIRQLYVMTDAGISIQETIKQVASATEDRRLKEIFHQVDMDLNSGMSLTESLKKFEDELGNVFIAMARLGEQSGNLADALKKLADIMQDVWDNQQKFKKALRYPIVVIIAIAIAFTILILFVVPEFRKIFEELGAQLPLPTQILLGIEYVMSNYGIYVLAGIIASIWFLKRLYKTDPKFKNIWDEKILKVYLIGNIIFYSTMNRFNLVFGQLVGSGIPIVDALETSTKTVSNTYLNEKISTIKISVQRGAALSTSMDDTGLYEGMLIQMILAGEKSGMIDAMLDKVTNYYKEKFDDIIDNISSYIEPILLIFIAGMVLLMALGIFLPMWDLGKAVKA